MDDASEPWLAEMGAGARQELERVRRKIVNLRDGWARIGQIAFAVKQTDARGSGVLDRWRSAHLPGVRSGEVSDAIWLAQFPSAAGLVRSRIGHPTAVRSAWRRLALDECRAFVRHRREDLDALVAELGGDRDGVERALGRAQRGDHDGGVDEDDLDDVLPPPEPGAGPARRAYADPFTAIRSMLDLLSGASPDVEAAREVGRRALEAGSAKTRSHPRRLGSE